ncbi:MAG: Co2+/Mg2+ efflux protein ApaG [Bacteroidia bacterium]|nr:MAG: Co2+/Mg2+ efflux protein ApaG [Bacteroidia bacterium]
MTSLISAGVLVNVEVYYQHEYSNPLLNEYMFAYQITLENYNSYPVQLLRRNWKIFDSIGIMKEIDGDGVVGVQPIIKPGESYQYMSGCNLQSDIGKMFGTYTMINVHSKQYFQVSIPEFEMFTPAKCN